MKKLLFTLLLTIPFVGFGQEKHHIDKVTWIHDTLTYLKEDMSLINGIVFCDFGELGSYKEGKKNGLWKDYDENGKIFSEESWKYGVSDGPYIYYFENGEIFERGNHKDGELEGLYQYYYENGQLQWEGNYKNGRMDGLWNTYYETGQLKEEWMGTEGVSILVKCWDEDGNEIECKEE